MKTLMPLCLVLAAGLCSCGKSTVGKGDNAAAAAGPQLNADRDSVTGDPAVYTDGLLPFRCVLDTLNSAGDRPVLTEYFLHDITGDGNPELWLKCGTCEADADLWVYTAGNGEPKKIFTDYGGHTEFYLHGDTLVSVTANTGTGYVSIYRYHHGKLKAKTADFSMWNEDGEAKALKKKEQPMIDLWESCDSLIPFEYLE